MGGWLNVSITVGGGESGERERERAREECIKDQIRRQVCITGDAQLKPHYQARVQQS